MLSREDTGELRQEQLPDLPATGVRNLVGSVPIESPSRFASRQTRDDRAFETGRGILCGDAVPIGERRPVIGLSHHDYALQHMALEWGVTPAWMAEAADVEELWSASMESGRKTGLLDEGDLVVLTAGTAVNIPGTTDMIKLAYA